VAKGETVTCMTSFTIEMPATELKTGGKNETAPNKNDMMRGTMISVAPSMTNLTDSAPLKEGAMESKPFPLT
jgi:hypothetical protein